MRPLPLAIVLAATAPFASAQDKPFHLSSLYHVGFWVKDIAKSRAFYHGQLGFEEPYSLNYPDGKLQMVVMKVNERQVIYLFPNPAKIQPNGDNLDHLGLECDHLQAFHDFLIAHQVKVGDVHRGRIGDLILGVKDPDGHTFEVTELTKEGQLLKHQGQALPATRAGTHLMSATVSSSDLNGSLRFYLDLLGFKMVEASDQEVVIQVPDGTDQLKLMVDAGRSVPDFTLQASPGRKPGELTDPDGTVVKLVP